MTLDTSRLLLELLITLRDVLSDDVSATAGQRIDVLLDQHFCLCKSSMVSECPVHGKIER